MMLTLTASILSRHLKRPTSHSLDNENGSSCGTGLRISSSHRDSNLLSSKDSDFILEPVGQIARKKFVLPKEAYMGLLNYQKDSMSWFWKLHCEGNGGILADDMGLGKTRQVIVFILGLFHSRIIERALIVAPPTLLKQWEEELLEWGLTVNIRQYYGEPTERYDALHHITEEGGVLLTTYDLIRSYYSQISGGSTSLWDYIIIDEGHLIKNPKTKSFKALVKIPCNHRIVVFGTPVQNCTELQKISNHPFQLTKKDTEELSETESGLTDEIGVVDKMGIMDEMASHLQELVPADDTVTAFTSSCKLKFIIKLLERLLESESGHRVLIISQTCQMLDAIQDTLSSLGYNFLRIDGKTKVEDRYDIVKRFSDVSGPPILLLSSRVGGLGLNLVAADCVIIADPSWNPSVDAQSVDRVYRLGQSKHVYIYRLIAACTIEEKIYEEQVAKFSISKATSEDKNFKRYIFKKRKNDFLTLPSKGFTVSLVQRRFEEESQNYELGQELSEHMKFLKEEDIIGVSIHSMLFRETLTLPTNTVESGEIKSFSTSTSYRRKSSSDIIKNAEQLARNPKDWPSVQKPCSSSVKDSNEGHAAEIESIEYKISRLQDQLDAALLTVKDNVVLEKVRTRIAKLQAERNQLLSEKGAMRSGA